jgi:tight adherence protein C
MAADYQIVMPTAIALLWSVFAAGATWYSLNSAAGITYVTLADGRREERRLPLLFRLLLPLTSGVRPFFKKKSFQRLQLSVFRKLASSGFDDVIAPDEYLSLTILTPLVMGSIIVFLLAGLFAMSGKPFHGANVSRFFALSAAVMIWLTLYPRMWLKQAIALRHKLIVRALPFVMDLLTLSVEAGLDFMAAARGIITRRRPDALGEELSRVLMEIQLGSTRRDALKHMADRIDHPDIHSLVTALAQADELGVSIGAILRIQSDQIRSKRFMRAEKLANEAPVKMLFPLVAFIFPSVFLILLGPIFLQMMHWGS